MEDGLDEEDCISICKLLAESGIDSIEISGNGTSVSGIRAHVNEGYFTPAARRVADVVSCLVMVVGGFRSADTMEGVLNQTKIALISLSRPLLREPDLPNKMKQNPAAVSRCISCNACYSSPSHKCIYYLSRHHDKRIERFFLLSPANLSYMMSGVTERPVTCPPPRRTI